MSNHPLTMNFIQHIIYTMEDENFNAKVQGKKHHFTLIYLRKARQSLGLSLPSSEILRL